MNILVTFADGRNTVIRDVESVVFEDRGRAFGIGTRGRKDDLFGLMPMDAGKAKDIIEEAAKP